MTLPNFVLKMMANSQMEVYNSLYTTNNPGLTIKFKMNLIVSPGYNIYTTMYQQ
jgi:hypothetical protein